jgi:FAD/FMN-containing dehydrogenase
MALSRSLEDFAAEVGGTDAGPVCVCGGGTRWARGGEPDAGTREVRAPAGIVTYVPAEMTVRVGAGTNLAELHAALAERRQVTALAGSAGSTVGGALADGRSSIDALRHGLARDVLLAARYVSADGRLVTAGGPTVKNVTGFDLCRLLVGSLGTLGLLGEVTVRTRPLPEATAWAAGPTDPFALFDRLYRPAAVLWDGTTTWVHLEGYAADVADQLEVCRAAGLAEVTGPPAVPAGRAAVTPAALRTAVPALRAEAERADQAGWSGRATADDALRSAGVAPAGALLAEIGTGVLHLDPTLLAAGAVAALLAAMPPHQDDRSGTGERLRALHDRLRDEFDPTRRLNPGRDPLAAR